MHLIEGGREGGREGEREGGSVNKHYFSSYFDHSIEELPRIISVTCRIFLEMHSFSFSTLEEASYQHITFCHVVLWIFVS